MNLPVFNISTFAPFRSFSGVAAKGWGTSAAAHAAAGALLTLLLASVPASSLRLGAVALPDVQLEFAEPQPELPAVQMPPAQPESMLVMPRRAWMGSRRFVRTHVAPTGPALPDAVEPVTATVDISTLRTNAPVELTRVDAAESRPVRRAVAASAVPTVQVQLAPPPLRFEGRPCRYPEVARQQAWEGTVVLLIHIAADGRVTRVELERSSGNPAADAEAVQTARTWRAVPIDEQDRLWEMVIRQPINFQLE